jgi:hypothetical protein
MVLITHGHFCGNFPQPDIFYTAGFELFGHGHGHLATLPVVSVARPLWL